LNDLILVLPQTARRIAPTLCVAAASVIPAADLPVLNVLDGDADRATQPDEIPFSLIGSRPVPDRIDGQREVCDISVDGKKKCPVDPFMPFPVVAL
jgi:hypothetical protein